MVKKVDLTGQRFGKLVVVSESTERDKNKNIMWHCLCDCGNKINVGTNRLNTGNTKSCGCLWSKNLEGERYGKLLVIRRTDERSNSQVVWECLCDCGNYKNVNTGSLGSGNTKSCGCGTTKIDLTGKRFGMLVVLGDSGERGSGGAVMWDCICDCGEKVKVRGDGLKSGRSTSCGCFKLERLASMSGENSPSYNQNLTDEERLKNRYQLSGGNPRVWSKQIMERDNYTCQICNQHGGNLNAHHLNGWNAFPEQRFDLDNGVTLCTDCHKEFHSQYGYGDNTREQFDEYAASKTLVLN